MLLALLLLEKKLRLKRLAAAAADEEAVVRLCRSGSCISPWKGLFWSKEWWDCVSSLKSWFEPPPRKNAEGGG